jgi:aminopeptidase N
VTKHHTDFALLDPDNNYKQVFGLKDSLQGALRPERTCYDVYYYNLTVKILPRSKSIEGSNQIYFKTTENTRKIQIDLFDNYTINSIQWQGKELAYNRIYNAVFIDFKEMLPVGSSQTITIKYEGTPRIAPSPPWNGGFVWKKKRSSLWVGVACEHLGASSWWPCKDHLTEKPDSMQINVQVPNGYQAISNGNLRKVVPIDNKYMNFTWFVSYPINSYCVTFYMGKFVNFSETVSSGNGTCNIDYYVLPHHLEKAKEYYAQTKEIVAVYETLFGVYEYQRDGLAMVEAPYEGMEHQSAIAIGDGYGKEKQRNYEDTRYDYLVVHETAHEWWGNTVTMGDMADAWISEGFATYAELLFMEQKFGYPAYLSACSKTMMEILNIWPMVGSRDVNDNTFIGGDIYNKGAIMLNNLRCIINNDDQFFLLIRNFYEQYKLKIATTNDFIQLVNKTTGNDYTDFFNKFLYSPEPPVLVYEYTLFNQKLKFTYRWVNVDENFSMPFVITLNDTLSYRLTGSTNQRIFTTDNVNTFYLPNEFRFNKDRLPGNAFTYYWTSWKR